jgi:hypothetical protein
VQKSAASRRVEVEVYVASPVKVIVTRLLAIFPIWNCLFCRGHNSPHCCLPLAPRSSPSSRLLAALRDSMASSSTAIWPSRRPMDVGLDTPFSRASSIRGLDVVSDAEHTEQGEAGDFHRLQVFTTALNFSLENSVTTSKPRNGWEKLKLRSGYYLPGTNCSPCPAYHCTYDIYSHQMDSELLSIFASFCTYDTYATGAAMDTDFLKMQTRRRCIGWSDGRLSACTAMWVRLYGAHSVYFPLFPA